MKKIEFSCWKPDEQITVQLEPEGMEFIVKDDEVLSFVAFTKDDNFLWHSKIDGKDAHVSLYPECKGLLHVYVYRNDILIWD